MSRSLKKGPYIFHKLEKRVIEAQEANKKGKDAINSNSLFIIMSLLILVKDCYFVV